jgi:hypothetical protein
VAPATLLHVRQLGPRRVLEAFTLTANAADDALTGRHRIVGETGARLRFGSGDVRRCLLITQRNVFIVSAPALDSPQAAPRVEPLRPPGDTGRRRIGESGDPASAPRQPYVVDASIVDGGFVVLLGTISDQQGRLVDYYDEQGRYLQSAMLPFTASAMAGAGPRFLVLHRDPQYRWWLSSWLTPMAARAGPHRHRNRRDSRRPRSGSCSNRRGEAPRTSLNVLGVTVGMRAAFVLNA